MKANQLADSALQARKESGQIDFKAGFDPESKGDWCEVLKDVFAMINSGGGVIAFGINNDGMPSGVDLSSLAALDPAVLTDKIAAYTGTHFADFSLLSREKGGQLIVCLALAGTTVPVIPLRPGTYEKSPGKQANAFSAGVVYCRHGAKSEPATSPDIGQMIERRVRQVRRSWLSGIRKIVTAPLDSAVSVIVSALDEQPQTLPKGSDHHGAHTLGSLEEGGTLFRITTDPSAPQVALINFDDAYPHRMNDLLRHVKEALQPTGAKVTSYDVQAMGAVHGVFERPEFSGKPQFGSRKYTTAFAEWLVAQVEKDRSFISSTRSKFRRMRRDPTVALPGPLSARKASRDGGLLLAQRSSWISPWVKSDFVAM